MKLKANIKKKINTLFFVHICISVCYCLSFIGIEEGAEKKNELSLLIHQENQNWQNHSMSWNDWNQTSNSKFFDDWKHDLSITKVDQTVVLSIIVVLV